MNRKVSYHSPIAEMLQIQRTDVYICGLYLLNKYNNKLLDIIILQI